MSENDDGADEAAEGGADGAGAELSPESLESRLDEAEAALDEAETEADLDAVESDLDAVADDLEAADLPEAEDDEEDGPREQLEERLEELRSQLEEARGPYAEDVAAEVEDARSTIEDTEWTESGVDDLVAAVRAFADAVDDAIGTRVAIERFATDMDEPKVQGSELTGITGALEDLEAAVADAGLDPDDDAETIAALLEAAQTLVADVDAAQEWADLSVRQQLDAHGYYDVLDHRKDYPPEWGALKVWEKEDRTDMVLLALDKQESDFMVRHCFEALARMGPEEAVEPMMDLAQQRNEQAIRVLGKIGSEEPVEGLLNYVDGGDVQLRTTTMKALGEIGSEAATQDVADQLVDDNPEVRSAAARALGLVGDTRAVEPLADVLADDDADEVRAAAAWALNSIGTERARDALAEYEDDSSYLVQTEAERAV